MITVRHGGSELGSVRKRVEQRPEMLAHGTGVVLYAILDHVVDGYGDVAQAIDAEIQAVEREVFSAARTNPAEWIYRLKREVLDLYRVAAPLLEAVSRSTKASSRRSRASCTSTSATSTTTSSA